MEIDMERLEAMVLGDKGFVRIIPKEERAALLADFEKPVSDPKRIPDYALLGAIYYEEEQGISYNNFHANIINWAPSARRELAEVTAENLHEDAKRLLGVELEAPLGRPLPEIERFYREIFEANLGIDENAEDQRKHLIGEVGQLGEQRIKNDEEREARLDKFVQDFNNVCTKYGYSDIEDFADKIKRWKSQKVEHEVSENTTGREVFEAGYQWSKDLSDMLSPVYEKMIELGYNHRDLCA